MTENHIRLEKIQFVFMKIHNEDKVAVFTPKAPMLENICYTTPNMRCQVMSRLMVKQYLVFYCVSVV